MNKTVCFFIPTLGFGGIEANTIRLAKAFVNDNYNVEIIVSNLKNDDYLLRVPSEVKIIDLKCSKIFNCLPNLIRYVNKRKPKALISASEGANIVAAFAKLFIREHTKVIISIRTHLSTEYKHISNKKKKLFPMLSRLIYPKVDSIVAVSNGVAKDASSFLKIPFTKINVIYNPIIDYSIKELMQENPNHPWLEEKKDHFVILGAGRLTKQKDFTTLIKAFYEVRKHVSVKLIIVGEGEEREKLKLLAQELNVYGDIDLVGFVQNPYSYMKCSDLFVMSSAWEGFGNVLVEAMATGTNVVSTDCPSGPSEILDNGTYGQLVETKDIEGLSKSIIDALQNPLSKEVLIERANSFTVKATLDKYKRIIER
ncbi:MAG: glycosyltransferase [Bacillota bacterium]